jgi:hypothetical protein
VVSKDGRCGGAKGQTCLGSELTTVHQALLEPAADFTPLSGAFGDCCSQYDYCGSSNAYCGTGCNPSFGTCNTTPSSSRSVVPTSARSSAPSPSATQKVSKNARCGPQFGGQTCLSSQWGDCCSQYSYVSLLHLLKRKRIKLTFAVRKHFGLLRDRLSSRIWKVQQHFFLCTIVHNSGELVFAITHTIAVINILVSVSELVFIGKPELNNLI